MSKSNTTSAILGDSGVFCVLHDQFASLGRHAQLTRCFSAVAELLVIICCNSCTCEIRSVYFQLLHRSWYQGTFLL